MIRHQAGATVAGLDEVWACGRAPVASQLPHSSASSHVTFEYDVEVTSIQSQTPHSATTKLELSKQSAPGSTHQQMPSSWPPNLAQATAAKPRGNSRQGNATSPTATTAPPQQSAAGFVHQQLTSSDPSDIVIPSGDNRQCSTTSAVATAAPLRHSAPGLMDQQMPGPHPSDTTQAAADWPCGNNSPGETTSALAEGSNAQHGDVSQSSFGTSSRSGKSSSTQHDIAAGQGHVPSSNAQHGIADRQGNITSSTAQARTAQRGADHMQGNVAFSNGLHGIAGRQGGATSGTAQESTAQHDSAQMQGDVTRSTAQEGTSQRDDNHMQGSASQEDSQWPVTVHLSNGKSYGADLVISAIGVEPNTGWLPHEITKDAKDGGICVDRYTWLLLDVFKST